MRIAFWVSLLAFAAFATAYAQEPIALPGGVSLSYAAAGSKTRLVIRTQAGQSFPVSVGRDATVPAKAAPIKVEVFGTIKGLAFILADTYASRPGGMSYCQAGEEQFLRVISIARKPARQTLQIKLASCRDNIELASPGIAWKPEQATLQLDWLQGPPPDGGTQSRTIQFNAEGQPVNP